MAATALMTLLEAEGVGYELIPHDHTERAADEADALGVPAASVAKTLIVTVPDGYILAVLPAARRLDLHKLREIVGAGSKAVHLASEDDLQRDFPEFELGAVPPVGGGRADPVFLDGTLSELDELVFEAGSHDESVRLGAQDLRRIADVRIVDISEE